GRTAVATPQASARARVGLPRRTPPAARPPPRRPPPARAAPAVASLPTPPHRAYVFSDDPRSLSSTASQRGLCPRNPARGHRGGILMPPRCHLGGVFRHPPEVF